MNNEKMLELKKEAVLKANNCIFSKRINAMVKAKELREKYNINVYAKRYTKESFVTGKDNFCKTYYKEVFVLC